MGRTTASVGAPPPSQRKVARAKRAKQTINNDIPALLQSYPRAKRGVEASELIVELSAVAAGKKHKLTNRNTAYDKNVKLLTPNASDILETSLDEPTSPTKPSSVRLRALDTLEAAAELHQTSNSRRPKSSRIAILNMASPLRPGGGFLNGATSQEESLCMRTTLYPALKEEFYRLPELGAVYTPDVLVFRSHNADATDLPKAERFFVDVITAAMHRMPDIEEDEDEEKRYANDNDREVAEQKMSVVMRIAKSKGVKKLVLGAWGCGAYGNPVSEIAGAWMRVLLSEGQGKPKANRSQSLLTSKMWNGMEVVFAIKERNVAELFAKSFGDNLPLEPSSNEDMAKHDENEGNETVDVELRDKVAELKSQIDAARSSVLKDRLQDVLEKLKVSNQIYTEFDAANAH